MKDELRTDNDSYAWSTKRTSQDELWQLRQPSPPIEFPGEQGMLTSMYVQVQEEEQVISLQFIGSQQDVSMCRRKKRKQVDDWSETGCGRCWLFRGWFAFLFTVSDLSF